MKSNEDIKTWISNTLVRNIFQCLKQVYCCLTFVCVYMSHDLYRSRRMDRECIYNDMYNVLVYYNIRFWILKALEFMNLN